MPAECRRSSKPALICAGGLNLTVVGRLKNETIREDKISDVANSDRHQIANHKRKVHDLNEKRRKTEIADNRQCA
jgi:hypothetical protein